MGGNIVIRAEGLGKKYMIGHQAEQERYTALRDVMARKLGGALRSARGVFRTGPALPRPEIEEFWALREVGFEIGRGEVVGVIGRNGAGKSTLLKVLSRITEPSEGRVTIKGRIASLLEVGTGFHPELTGRENIFLNGAILGMNRTEIKRKFDEIVDFAGVERFLDTPVKRYSSGMYVRLAFAVAAHLEPEILVVDEVLAVGDAEFQKKCLGKMQDVAGHGRTVLFVSHNMAAIEQLCTRAIHLEKGRVKLDGSAKAAVSDYLSNSERDAVEYVPESDPTRVAEVQRIILCDSDGAPLTQVTTADAPSVKIELVVRQRQPDLKLAVSLHDSHQGAIFSSCPTDSGASYPSQPGRYEFLVVFPRDLLMAQRYSLTISLYSAFSGKSHSCQNSIVFDVVPAASHFYNVEPDRVGVVYVLCKWEQKSFVAWSPVE